MDQYAILLAYFDKQILYINKIYQEITQIDVTVYEKQFVFAMRVQQFYPPTPKNTALQGRDVRCPIPRASFAARCIA